MQYRYNHLYEYALENTKCIKKVRKGGGQVQLGKLVSLDSNIKLLGEEINE